MEHTPYYNYYMYLLSIVSIYRPLNNYIYFVFWIRYTAKITRFISFMAHKSSVLHLMNVGSGAKKHFIWIQNNNCANWTQGYVLVVRCDAMWLYAMPAFHRSSHSKDWPPLSLHTAIRIMGGMFDLMLWKSIDGLFLAPFWIRISSTTYYHTFTATHGCLI